MADDVNLFVVVFLLQYGVNMIQLATGRRFKGGFSRIEKNGIRKGDGNRPGRRIKSDVVPFAKAGGISRALTLLLNLSLQLFNRLLIL